MASLERQKAALAFLLAEGMQKETKRPAKNLQKKFKQVLQLFNAT